MIVSEETGTISVAIGGMLKRHLAPQTLEKLLTNELIDNTERVSGGIFGRVKNRIAKRTGLHHEEK